MRLSGGAPRLGLHFRDLAFRFSTKHLRRLEVSCLTLGRCPEISACGWQADPSPTRLSFGTMETKLTWSRCCFVTPMSTQNVPDLR